MDQAMLRAFAGRVGRGELGPELQIRYRVAGGMPGRRLECEVVVDSVNGARVSRVDDLAPDAEPDYVVRPDELDVPELLRSVSRGLPGLTPVSRRVTRRPDSLVGRLTVVLDGAEESFHIVPEREKRSADEGLSPGLDRALQQLWVLATGDRQAKGRSDRG